MGATLLRFTENARKFVAPPAVDLRVVAFPGPPLRLLAGPAQTGVQEATDVIGMVGDAEAATDQFGDAAAGPQFIGPAVGLGPLEQELLQLEQLRVGQAWCLAGPRFGSQTATLLLLAEPVVQSNTMHAENACDNSR